MIAQRYQQVIRRLGGLIDSRMEADGPPPSTLMRFFRWVVRRVANDFSGRCNFGDVWCV